MNRRSAPRLLLLAVLQAQAAGLAWGQQCVASHRTDGQFIGYDAVRIVFAAGTPDSAIQAVRTAMDQWNADRCNTGGTSFPRLQEALAGAGRTMSVEWHSGSNPRNPESCGRTEGNVILLYSQARETTGSTRSCDTIPILADNATHELGHLMGLADQAGVCNQYAMGQVAFTPSGAYVPRHLQDTECRKVRDTNDTPIERQIELCETNPTAPGCRDCVRDESGNCHSPILLDLRGDGFRLTSTAAGVRFDLDADGFAEQTSWTDDARDDAFLVLDRDSDGGIDDGGELFGNHTPFLDGAPAPNGFLALYELDIAEGNSNGSIDPGDPVFGRLRLWRDRNHDGVAQPRELRTLAEAGICAIGTEYELGFAGDEHGNLFRFLGTAWRCDPPLGWRRVPCVDVIFRTEASAP